jgi:hypothetical protein|tara:strand:+ start:85 stop:231 length:147 start_codon:yes stop_codon:yes gene_type:complete
MKATGGGGKGNERILKDIREILQRMEKRLKVIENTIQKTENKKQLLND